MGKGRVLVIDDEPEIRQSVRLALVKSGYEVVVAEDGEKGIAAIKAGDNPRKVDVILCDIYMPKVNGMEAIACFRSEFPSVPVIVMTGKPDTSNAEALFKQGVVEYLVKPFETEALMAAVNKAVTSHRAS